MTDRDHFAAAALAGLMSNPKNNDSTADTIRFWAWNWADAMLRDRERTGSRPTVDGVPGPLERTNHDAAPAARAEDVLKEPTGRFGGEPAEEPEGTVRTGDTQEPVAWAVCTPENWGQETPCFFCEQQARDHASAITGMKNIVKLYRSPTLTDEEREALRRMLPTIMYEPHKKVVESILARFG